MYKNIFEDRKGYHTRECVEDKLLSSVLDFYTYPPIGGVLEVLGIGHIEESGSAEHLYFKRADLSGLEGVSPVVTTDRRVRVKIQNRTS